MMIKSGTKVIELPENLLLNVEEFIANHPNLGYSTPSEFINNAIRKHLDFKYNEEILLDN